MLKDYPTHTTVPCQNLERARGFYSEKLGLEASRDEPGGLIYEGPHGSRFLLFQSGGAASGDHTQMGWQVDNIEAQVKELKGRGVKFEDYDFDGFDRGTSIATFGTSRSAWFKDSEGNLLGIVQLPG